MVSYFLTGAYLWHRKRTPMPFSRERIKEINTEEISHSLLTNSEDLIVVSTPDTVMKFVNRAYCDFFQRKSSELIGTRFFDNFSEERGRKFKTMIQGLTPEHPTNSSTHRSGLPGNEKWILWHETGIFDDSGKLTEILSVGRNVNEIVEMQEEKDKLLYTLEAFKSAIDTNIISSITDTKGVITYANDNFCKISKYTRDEIQGRTHSILNSGFHHKEFFVEMWRTISGGSMWTGDIRNRAKDGTYYWVESVIMPIKDNGGVVTGYLSIRILINERKKLEEERSKYLKSLEDMLFIVSHEIRKPITGCQGILDLMSENMISSGAEFTRAMDYLRSSADEMDSYSRKLNEYLERNIMNANR